MIGIHIESESIFPTVTVVFALLGMALVGCSVLVGNYHWSIFAILPLAISFALYVCWERAFQATLTDQGLHLPKTDIPYEEMISVKVTGKVNPSGNQRLIITHTSGELLVPADISVPTVELHRFLLEHCPPKEQGRLHPQVAEFAATQKKEFGEGRVWKYTSRQTLTRPAKRSCAIAVVVAFIFTGIAWLLIGVLHHPAQPWAGGAAIAMVAGLILILIKAGKQGRRKRLEKLCPASLVVSPVGIAMVQGDLQGKLLWEEVRGVRLKNKSEFFATNNTGKHIAIAIAGGLIAVFDVYDERLEQIVEIMQRHIRAPS